MSGIEGTRGRLDQPHDDLKQFAEWVAGLVETIASWEPGSAVEEGATLEPIFVAVAGTGDYILVPCGDVMSDGDAADELAYELFPKLLRELDAKRYGWVTEVWTVEDIDPKVEGGKLRDHEHRVERVNLLVGEWTGEMMFGLAAINRDVGKIGEWDWVRASWDSERVGDGLQGRFVDAPMAFLTGRSRITAGEIEMLVKDVAAVPAARGLMARAVGQAAQEAGISPEEFAAMAPDEAKAMMYRLMPRSIEISQEDQEASDILRALFQEHSPVKLRERKPGEE